MKTKTEQKRIERQRNRDNGLVFFGVWVKPEQREQLKEIAHELCKLDNSVIKNNMKIIHTNMKITIY